MAFWDGSRVRGWAEFLWGPRQHTQVPPSASYWGLVGVGGSLKGTLLLRTQMALELRADGTRVLPLRSDSVTPQTSTVLHPGVRGCRVDGIHLPTPPLAPISVPTPTPRHLSAAVSSLEVGLLFLLIWGTGCWDRTITVASGLWAWWLGKW